MKIAEALQNITSELPAGVRLIAVSKTYPAEIIQEAYGAGQRLFGENKAQELRDKYALLPKDIEWHFIGHLQTNKIKYIIDFVSLIHSIDSIKLLSEINKEAKKAGRVVNCLLQFHVAKEETKYGMDMDEAVQLLTSEEYASMEYVKITGVMGMATYTEDTDVIHKEFHSLKSMFNELKEKYFAEKDDFQEISMGMSSDYRIAVEEGSTLIRVGSLIFGERNYSK